MTEPDNSHHYRPFPEFSKWQRAEDLEVAYEKYAELLKERRRAANPEALKRAVKTATRIAAVDTGAIEGIYQVDRGFTRTVAVEAAAWEAAVEAHGPGVRNTIEDALNAYELILDLATKHVPVTEAFIRSIHSTICESQETYTVHTPQGPQVQSLPKGEYKRFPNNPTSLTTGRVHHYAPVMEAATEMQRLVAELSSVEFGEAHPILQAAYAHYAFVCVHPFADGNGRVARALASVYLYRRPGVPLVIFADQKDVYIDALESADDGDPSPFIDFVRNRVIDSIQLVLSHVPNHDVPDLSATLSAFKLVQLGRGGLSHAEVDALNARILEAVQGELQSGLAELGFLQAQLGWQNGSSPVPIPNSYRAPGSGTRHVLVSMNSGPPASFSGHTTVSVFTAVPNSDVPDFLLISPMNGIDPLEVFMREIHPGLTQVFQFKIAAWAERIISILAHQVVTGATDRLRQQGYIE
ncbi:Fic family protein [Micromonospora foliorum]|uniref:Fic family protein n=1 Tax=Micromonospora foliorum TaxID=2911210 RepID=UPI001EE7D14C|nr:Fic family protein [Micromonospora foliorum]MCG5440635.1 Fic family protein [Micromonospora foliorum]